MSSTSRRASCWPSASATSATTTRSSRSLRGTDIVIHAAALKQVPSCEYFPVEAVRTNVMGADALVRATMAARLARRDRCRHLHRQGVQADQRHGHDQGGDGAHPRRGQPAPARHALCLRALRQRRRVARLGGAAVPRADRPRRSGDDHAEGDDALPAHARSARWTRCWRRSSTRNAARSTCRVSRRPA